MSYSIPFNRVSFAGREQVYIAQAIANGHISGDGIFTKKCQRFLEERCCVPKAFLTTSCTHSLEMSAILLDISHGDEIIVPSFTFTSTVNAFVLRGAKPIFIDIRPDTLNMDETKLERLITPRTKAIVPVHYGGVGCEMDIIMDISKRHKIAVIEDNAHGLFGKYKNRFLGTFGIMSAQSFHETKNFTCGEGGALFVNNKRLIKRAEIIREKGTNRTSFFRGEVDKYGWMDIGSSYLPSDLLAAFLLAQLERYKEIQLKRKKIWNYYYANLKDWAQENDVALPEIPRHCEHPYHLFYMIVPSMEKRKRLIDYLKKRGILSIFHYLPLHLSKMGKKFGAEVKSCPISEDISGRLLRLPFFNSITKFEQEKVVGAIKRF